LDWHESLLRQILALKLASQYYDNGSEDPLYESIMQGPQYSEFCKKRRTEAFFSATKDVRFDRREIDLRPTTYYSDCWHEKLNISWEENDPLDILYMNLEVQEDPDILKRFRSTAKEMFKNITFEIPNNDEVLMQMRNSSTYKPEQKGLYHSIEVLKASQLEFSSELRGRRTVLQVSPANVRDTVVLSLPSLASVTKSELLIGSINNCFTQACLCKNMKIGYDRFHKFKENLWTLKDFYCRDFKKCGLTFNVKLFRIIKEVLKELYPKHSEVFDVLKIYDNIIIDTEEKVPGLGRLFRPKRGYILGMASQLVTLCQVVIHQMNLNESQVDEVEAIFYHDDTAVSGYNDALQQYIIADKQHLNGLGLIYKDETTDILHRAYVFLEEYFSHCDSYVPDKRERLRWSIYRLLSYANITAAKEIINSLPEEDFILIGEDVAFLQRTYKYEFFKEEIDVPYIFGGWRTPITEFKDESLLYLEPLHQCAKAYKAMQARVKIPKAQMRAYKNLSLSERPLDSSFLILDSSIVPELSSTIPRKFIPRHILFKIIKEELGISQYTSVYYNRLLKSRRRLYWSLRNETVKEDFVSQVLIEKSPSNLAIPRQYLNITNRIITQLVRNANPVKVEMTQMEILFSYLKHKYPGKIETFVFPWSDLLLPHYFDAEATVEKGQPKLEVLVNLLEMDSTVRNLAVNPYTTSHYYISKYGGVPESTKLLKLPEDRAIRFLPRITKYTLDRNYIELFEYVFKNFEISSRPLMEFIKDVKKNLASAGEPPPEKGDVKQLECPLCDDIPIELYEIRKKPYKLCTNHLADNTQSEENRRMISWIIGGLQNRFEDHQGYTQEERELQTDAHTDIKEPEEVERTYQVLLNEDSDPLGDVDDEGGAFAGLF
jgi:hypothetical protein